MKCKICNTETDVKLLIKRVAYPVCEDCTKSIALTFVQAAAGNKTIFDIGAKKERKAVEKHPEIAADVLTYLYCELLKQRDAFSPNALPQGYLELISARVNQGHTVEELKAVTYLKYKEWNNTDQQRFLRADTLYRPMNFKRYLSEVEVKKPNWKVVSTTDQKKIIKELNSYGIGGATEETDILAKKLMATGYTRKEFLNNYLIEKI